MHRAITKTRSVKVASRRAFALLPWAAMFERLFRLYQRKKIVNVNFNIVAAGLLAIVIAAYPVHLVAGLINRYLVESVYWWAIPLAAALIDGIIDVTIYFSLHWLANHWRPLKPVSEADRRHHAKKERFWRTATFIQAERYLLSPIFYFIAMGGMWLLHQVGGMGNAGAFVISFSVAIIVTRIIHTVWGMWSGRFAEPDRGPEGAD